MNRQRVLSSAIITSVLLGLVACSWKDQTATSASQPKASADGDKDSISGQVKELQKQVVALQKQVAELQKQAGEQKPSIVAAGTASIKLGARQENKASILVKLPGPVVAKLGGNCIVQLTNRCPTGGSFFTPYWTQTADGFEITLVDTALTGTAIYRNANTYHVDWIVVQK